MKVVWKYPISIFGSPLSMPRGARIIHAGPDAAGALCAWAEVDPGQPTQARNVRIIGTGGTTIPDGFTHAGTFVDGEFVWHVYVEDQP